MTSKVGQEKCGQTDHPLKPQFYTYRLSDYFSFILYACLNQAMAFVGTFDLPKLCGIPSYSSRNGGRLKLPSFRWRPIRSIRSVRSIRW